jgi:hypothetical protein
MRKRQESVTFQRTMWNKMKLAAQIRIALGGGIMLPDRMFLCPGLLWLTLNLALIIHCLS